MTNENKLYSTIEISEILNCCRSKAQILINKEKLVPTQIRKTFFYTYWQLLILLKKY